MARLANALKKAWPCLASAVLLNLAFAPFNLSLLVFAALAPWLVSLKDKTGKEGFRSGWTFGFLYMLGQLAWMFSFVDKWTHSPGLSLIPYVLGCAYCGLYFGILGWQIALCWRHQWVWAIPLVWAGMEVFRSYIPGLAFPYGLIATPLWVYPFLIQHAYYGSIYLVGAWVVIANVIFTLFLAGEASWQKLRGYATVLAFGLILSMVRLQTPVSGKHVTVALGQPGVDLAYGDPQVNDLQIKSIVEGFYKQAHRFEADFLVLPEGVASSRGIPFGLDPTMPVLFGGQRKDERFEDVTYQTAFSFDRKWSYADKTRLVIFGEYVPFRKQLPFIAEAFQLPGGDLVPSDSLKTLEIKKIKVGPLLCFEGLFPDLAFRHASQGAQLLAVMSVDDWYMGTAAPDQLMAGGVWRAVETGLPLVRSASLGYSYAVEPHGNILVQIPLKETQVARVELPLTSGGPFPLFPVFPILAVLSLVGLPLASAVKARKKA